MAKARLVRAARRLQEEERPSITIEPLSVSIVIPDAEAATTELQKIGLDPRVAASLLRNGYRTLGDLLESNERELLLLPGLGPYSAKNVVGTLRRLGLRVRKESTSS